MPKVLNRRFNSEGVYIGRPTKWGNPYIIGDQYTREEAIQKYEKYLTNNPELIRQAKIELKGKDLVCYCAPLKCHGDILLKIANE